jgi:hypothetical protein
VAPSPVTAPLRANMSRSAHGLWAGPGSAPLDSGPARPTRPSASLACAADPPGSSEPAAPAVARARRGLDSYAPFQLCAIVGSCRVGGRDTKTRKSRRTLALPQLAVTALQALHDDSEPQPRGPGVQHRRRAGPRRRHRPPVVPDRMHGRRDRPGLDAPGTAAHLRQPHVRQRRRRRGDRPARRPRQQQSHRNRGPQARPARHAGYARGGHRPGFAWAMQRPERS